MTAAQLIWTRIDPEGPGLHSPKRPGDAGFDLEAAVDVILGPGEQQDIPTNIRVKLPPNCWGEMRARSSIAQRNLAVAATLIDNGYTGPLFVLLRNTNGHPGRHTDDWGRVVIKRGERIAQLVLHQGVPAIAWEVAELDDDPRRGSLGFGSTGL